MPRPLQAPSNGESDVSPHNGVLLLSGYGLRIFVERGHLCVEDGVGASRRYGRFPRPTRDLQRLVVLGHSGTISFDALRWLSDVGAGFVQIDSDGRVIAAAGPVGLQDARLRRVQAQAAQNGLGLELAKGLVREKLTRQCALLDRLPESVNAGSVVQELSERIDSAVSVEVLRRIEAEAAVAYWAAWAPVELHFNRRDARRVPAHWRTFSRRSSLVTGSPRKATNPANATLNYLYAIAEAEARLAALAVGCDPGLGVMHADQRSRDSLACDLMEPVRPLIDRCVLDLLENQTFRRADFFETRQGVCRIMPPLTKGLAETAPRWSAAVAPIAERLVRDLLAHDSDKKSWRDSRPVPTPLTQGNRSAGRDGVRVRSRKKSHPQPPSLPRACVICGTELEGRKRRYCDSCRPTRSREAMSKAHEVLRARRASGDSPAHSDEATRRKSKQLSARRRANLAWERRHPGVSDPDTFTQEIQPRLGAVPVAAMMRATGLSRVYCTMIRRGDYVPHPRHWEALEGLPALNPE